MSRRRFIEPTLRRGFTLIELMVGVFIALFLTAAAITFASHETKLLGYSNDQIDLEQSGRAAIDLLAQDIRMAGAGVGYGINGAFNGFQTGTFTVPGGASFNNAGTTQSITLTGSDTNGAHLASTSYSIGTQDLLIATADGSYASIAFWNSAGGEYCSSTDTAFRTSPAEQALLRDPSGAAFIAGSITSGAIVSPCTWGQCAGSCVAFTFAANPGGNYVTFSSDNAAGSAPYIDGEVMGGFKHVVWFVANQAPPYNYAAQLRRVVFDGSNSCASRDTCGQNTSVADYVEALSYQIWTFNTTATPTPQWQIMPLGSPLVPTNRGDRIRVDIEIVVRSHISDDHAHQAAVLRLQPQPNGGMCIPGGGVATQIDDPSSCPGGRASWDWVVRKTYRTSVEVKNSGRQAIR
jgi:prepilin-type N-terminal cleavage/methylation domain-containing protein